MLFDRDLDPDNPALVDVDEVVTPPPPPFIIP
jgi:hypothetical protein